MATTKDVVHPHVPKDEEDVRTPELVQHRELSAAVWSELEGYVAKIFSALGMRLDSPGTRETPRRFLRALFDATEGYEGDLKLLTAFPTECKGGPHCHLNQI